MFTQDFLGEGIVDTAAWRDLEGEEVARFGEELHRIFADFPVSGTPNEATTEQDLIEPLLAALGWTDYLPQQTTSGHGRTDVPDYLLFPGHAAKQRSRAESAERERFRHGVAVLEAKRWERPLDRGERRGRLADGAPSTQMLRYLSRAETVSEGLIRWGILTNGRLWRLYFQGARSRSEEFFEMDVAVLSGAAGIQPDLVAKEMEEREHYLRVFYLLFRRLSFLPQPDDPEGRSFHAMALAESRLWEEKVSTDLGRAVFDKVFPDLLASFLRHDPEAPSPPTRQYLDTLRREGLTFLYRLLFILYAEDRHLLPVTDSRYDDYSLRAVRTELARRLNAGDAFSARATNHYDRLHNLFMAVGEGDPGIGLPPYDGGLFAADQHPLLERSRIPDSELAPLLDDLSRREEDGERRWINYRDLSVQQLGSIYERLLEFEPVVGDDGHLDLQPNPFARKTSGSYYTHDDLVQLILRRTVGPLIHEIESKFDEANARLASAKRAKDDRLRELATFDPAAGILGLKVCDPAMGSGHFLVSLVDYLADQALEAMARVEAAVHWAPQEQPYVSPLAGRIEAIRAKVLANAAEDNWVIDEEDLDDRHIVRRVILKRVVFGVDKNPMAVELAKVSLWLHTFTTGAPLSFIDHHLRCGDSLYGEWLDGVLDELEASVGPVYLGSVRAALANAANTMGQLARITDDDIAEVQESHRYFEQAEDFLEPLRRLLDLWQARRWMAGGGKKKEHPGFAPLLRGEVGDLTEVLAAGRALEGSKKANKQVDALLADVREIAERERFLHWELAFPTVWKVADSGRRGGFDAVIGNPPWDRLKLQEVEWFAARDPAIAKSARASERKKKIRALAKAGSDLWDSYQEAKRAAETAARVARSSESYPLLARGDINIYALFVERALGLVQPEGIVGLLVPPGIASDKHSSEFFRTISTGGRLGGLFDFENKKVFFPDVDSRQKFVVLVAGGKRRRFEEAMCAFFLHAVEELEDPDRSFPLNPQDFATVNPNTGTAPIFRSRRDAEITKGVYRRLSVLVDLSGDEPQSAWPVKYATMFHMTNDSNLFMNQRELEESGFYQVKGNQFRKGDELFKPLYEGKMVQMYDHRGADIEMNPENLHRPAQPRAATLGEHKDPKWLPTPLYWVSQQEISLPSELGWTIGFKDITSPTNARTMIAAAFPVVGFGNKVPILRPISEDSIQRYIDQAPLLLATLNSFVFDFIARIKVHGQTINLYILEQLPVPHPKAFDQEIAGRKIGDLVRDEVLHLSYTAVDMEPFARDLGYEGDPFIWDEEDRRHRRARLDALFFLLYGISEADADYILNQFPIVRDDDEEEFGNFRTRDLILAYMKALEAGDLDSRPSV